MCCLAKLLDKNSEHNNELSAEVKLISLQLPKAQPGPSQIIIGSLYFL